MRGLFGAAVAVAGLFAPVSASLAQNTHISRLYEQILQNIDFAEPGHVLDTFGVIRIDAEQSVRIDLNLPADSAVEIMGDCDEDCFDLDLAVYDQDGKIIGEDRADDYYPIVQFETGAETRVTIEIDLVDCSASYCYGAYSVFIDG